jgi:thiol-disulfide isomerase/thioredoxin
MTTLSLSFELAAMGCHGKFNSQDRPVILKNSALLYDFIKFYKEGMMVKKHVVVALVVFLLVFTLAEAMAGGVKILNEAAPGSTVDIEKNLVKGKTTIFDFYADWCGPCKRIAPSLEKLQEKNATVAVFKINIDKWNSPVCQQYNIKSVPCFKIYDGNGKLQYEGKEAYQKVLEMIK